MGQIKYFALCWLPLYYAIRCYGDSRWTRHLSMIIIINNLPLETTSEDLNYFIKHAGIPISIEESVIFSRPDIDSSPLERIALLWISPNSEGTRIIKRLNGRLFKGQNLVVREYIIRSVTNEPRKNEPDTTTNFKEQRIAERRRNSLIIPWQINRA